VVKLSEKRKMIRVQKMKDSVGIRFPKRLVEDLNLKPHDYVEVTWDSEKVVIRKVNS